MLTHIVISLLLALQAPTDRTLLSNSNLVTVPVVAEKSGEHVSGLSRDQFTVFEDGVAQKLALFEEVNAPANEPLKTPAIANDYTNQLQVQPGAAVTVLLLDQVHTGYAEYYNAREEAMRFLSRNARADQHVMIAVLTWNGLKIVHSLSDPPEVAVRALRTAAGTLSPRADSTPPQSGYDQTPRTQPPQSSPSKAQPVLEAETKSQFEDLQLKSFVRESPNEEALRQDLRAYQNRIADVTLDGLEQIAGSLSGLPGLKTLLWVFPGYVCPVGLYKSEKTGAKLGGDHCERISRLLASNNIVVYPVNPAQTENPTYSDASCQGPCWGRTHPIMKELTLQTYAQLTGGRVCSYRNDLASCYQRAVDEGSHYYLLGYYAKPANRATWRRLKVRIAAAGVKVRSRSGYLIGDAETGAADAQFGVAAAVVSPIDFTGLPLSFRWGSDSRDGASGRSYSIHIPAGVLDAASKEIDLSLTAVFYDAARRVLGRAVERVHRQLEPSDLSQVRKLGVHYIGTQSVPAQCTLIRFIVRDELTGRIGSVTVPAVTGG